MECTETWELDTVEQTDTCIIATFVKFNTSDRYFTHVPVEVSKSVDMLMERSGQVELLVQKSEHLLASSHSFVRETKRLQHKSSWRNMLLDFPSTVWKLCDVRFLLFCAI